MNLVILRNRCEVKINPPNRRNNNAKSENHICTAYMAPKIKNVPTRHLSTSVWFVWNADSIQKYNQKYDVYMYFSHFFIEHIPIWQLWRKLWRYEEYHYYDYVTGKIWGIKQRMFFLWLTVFTELSKAFWLIVILRQF